MTQHRILPDPAKYPIRIGAYSLRRIQDFLGLWKMVAHQIIELGMDFPGTGHQHRPGFEQGPVSGRTLFQQLLVPDPDEFLPFLLKMYGKIPVLASRSP